MNSVSVLKMNGFVKSYYCLGEKTRLCINANYRPMCIRNSSNNAVSTENVIENQEEYEIQEKDLEIDKIIDKSRLKPWHRNILLNKKPYLEPQIDAHLTVKYNRRMFGEYGSESGVNPGISWPTKEDLEARREYEKVAYPFTIQEMVLSARNKIEEEELNKQRRHNQVLKNLAKLEQWKTDLKLKMAKKEAEAIAAKEKKDKLFEEVRRHFGFKVDPKDERFKEMLELKEKQQKKKDKEARLLERERQAIARVMKKNEDLIKKSEGTS